MRGRWEGLRGHTQQQETVALVCQGFTITSFWREKPSSPSHWAEGLWPPKRCGPTATECSRPTSPGPVPQPTGQPADAQDEGQVGRPSPGLRSSSRPVHPGDGHPHRCTTRARTHSAHHESYFFLSRLLSPTPAVPHEIIMSTWSLYFLVSPSGQMMRIIFQSLPISPVPQLNPFALCVQPPLCINSSSCLEPCP